MSTKDFVTLNEMIKPPSGGFFISKYLTLVYGT